MKINKAEAADLIDREYINGTVTLKELAARLGCTWNRLAQIGKELVPGYTEKAKQCKRDNEHKFIRLYCRKN